MESAQPLVDVEALQRENRQLKQMVDLLEQVVEALGDDNRYFAGLVLGHSPDQKEALEFYCDPRNEGAKGHRQRVRERAEAAASAKVRAA